MTPVTVTARVSTTTGFIGVAPPPRPAPPRGEERHYPLRCEQSAGGLRDQTGGGDRVMTVLPGGHCEQGDDQDPGTDRRLAAPALFRRWNERIRLVSFCHLGDRRVRV